MKNDKIKNIALIIIFLFVLYFPTVSFLFLKDKIKVENMENRELAKMPIFSFNNIVNIPKQWDEYYNDNLPYRQFIVNNWRNINFNLLNESSDDRVIVGENENHEKWLFYNRVSDGHELSFIDGTKILNMSDVDKAKQCITEQTNKMKKMGIDLYYVIGPNKSSIYSQYLPKTIEVKNDYFELFNNELKNKGINNVFFDLELLKNNDKGYETYYRTDTHWNEYGSYIYTKKLMSSIYNKDILNDQSVDYKYQDSKGKDLHSFTGLSISIKDNLATVNYKNDNVKETSIKTDKDYYTIYENDDYLLNETVVLIGDSFTTAQRKHFSRIYKRVIYFNLRTSTFYSSVLEKYKVSKVFYIRVERSNPDALCYNFFNI